TLLRRWIPWEEPSSVQTGCPKPPNITFAEIVIDRITVGSKVRYTCEVGYKRKLGQTDVFVCVNDTGLIYWNITTTSICIGKITPMPSLWGGPQGKPGMPPHRAGQSPAPMPCQGYCGIPRSMEHARYRMTKYGVGQELNYRCLSGYVAQSPTFAISVCKKDGDKLLWKELRLECTNDSKSGEETTQPIPVTGTTGCSGPV
uniref:Interleukin-2 receptor subunit alpha n=1 Tax=Pelusios castaneus TaxID=367368 RepID=A0A8C8R7S6_9SAUR